MIFDVLIIGGGTVGASLAAALKSGLTVGLVESLPMDAESPGWDSRIYAVSPGNAAFLAECGAWGRIDKKRIQQVEMMRIYGDAGAELSFSAYQLGVPELAFILENRAMQQALWQELRQQENLTLFHPARPIRLAFEDDCARVELDDGQSLCARLIVGADGRNSWVREQAGICEPATPYHQHGVVANFQTEKPHRGTAYQWFTPEGILALLPMPGQMVSMVWSVEPAKAEALLQASAEALCRQVAAASFHALGELALATPPAATPLRLLNLPHIVKPHLALVGDAAHNVHPLAGQGINLGFRDAKALAWVLNERGPHDCGDLPLLRRYERARREDIVSMQLTTDALKKLFCNDDPILRAARNIGLSATQRFIPLKKMLARHALN